MPTPTVVGLEDDQDILQNERVIEMDDTIAYLDPDESQFTTMLQRVARKGCDSTKVEWLEDELFPRLSSVQTAYTNVATAVIVAAGEGVYFRPNDLVRNAKTGECFKVVSVSTDTLDVTGQRGLGRVTAAAGGVGEQLLIIGNASRQGATLGLRAITKRVAQYNYTMIQRNPYGFTKSLMASKLYGGPEPMKERKKKATEHKRSIEYGLFWGSRALILTASEPAGQAGGVFEFVTTNVQNAAGTLTKVLLDTYMRQFLQHGSKNKVLFVSPVVAQAISGFLRDAWQPSEAGAARLWGAQVNGFISGAYGGQVPVVVKRDWNDFSTATGQYGGWAFLIDMDGVTYRTLRDTQLLRDRQANDADTTDEEYLTEWSFQLQQEKTHGIITGCTG